ncbi:hypothetical protein HY032_01165 [Candidatus Gottesmanbacteria bacterium]|nr:hypothetical protein [Candidatus Gottesmanbacteria bacterium]
MPPQPDVKTRFIEIRSHQVEVDYSIADLVLSLNLMGIDTGGSCEGHLDGKRHPYPWVATNRFLDIFDNGSLSRLRELLAQFNEQSEIPWEYSLLVGVTPASDILTKFGITPKVRGEFVDATQTHVVPISPDNLGRLQQSARELGEFLLTSLRTASF